MLSLEQWVMWLGLCLALLFLVLCVYMPGLEKRIMRIERKLGIDPDSDVD